MEWQYFFGMVLQLDIFPYIVIAFTIFALVNIIARVIY